MSTMPSYLATARSFLYVPADRPDRYEKALASGADAIIIDLEDAVAPHAKDAARAALDAAWERMSSKECVLIRINSQESLDFADDSALCASLRPAGVVVPKAEHADALAVCHERLGGLALMPMIESARGWANVQEIACAAGTQRLAFGHIDFQADLGMNAGDDEAELAPVRLALVAASRVAGIAPPVDGIVMETRDAARIKAATRRAQRFGFTGKLCIHPDQIVSVHAGFAFDSHEIAWARRVLEAADAAQGAAVQVDGRMVDRAVILRAERMLLVTAQGEDSRNA